MDLPAVVEVCRIAGGLPTSGDGGVTRKPQQLPVDAGAQGRAVGGGCSAPVPPRGDGGATRQPQQPPVVSRAGQTAAAAEQGGGRVGGGSAGGEEGPTQERVQEIDRSPLPRSGFTPTPTHPSALHTRARPYLAHAPSFGTDRTRNARAPTSPRSTGFCAILGYISSSSSSPSLESCTAAQTFPISEGLTATRRMGA